MTPRGTRIQTDHKTYDDVVESYQEVHNAITKALLNGLPTIEFHKPADRQEKRWDSILGDHMVPVKDWDTPGSVIGFVAMNILSYEPLWGRG